MKKKPMWQKPEISEFDEFESHNKQMRQCRPIYYQGGFMPGGYSSMGMNCYPRMYSQGGYPGGFPGGYPGGFPGGYPGGFPGGAPSGYPGGNVPAPCYPNCSPGSTPPCYPNCSPGSSTTSCYPKMPCYPNPPKG